MKNKLFIKSFVILFCFILSTYWTTIDLLDKEARLEIQFDPTRPSHNFWTQNDDKICFNLSTKFALSGSLPLLALASYPGSGNTWVRYMVEVTTGVFTAAIREVCC